MKFLSPFLSRASHLLSPRAPRASRRAFTIVELLIFIAIFVVVVSAFITILVSVTRVQVRQTAASEVNQQSQFLLQQVQYYVERSSLIDLAQDAATSTLRLRMATDSEDPTIIYLASSTVYIQQGASAAAQLTSSKVNVTALTFTKRAHASAHDSVSVSFIIAYNGSLQQTFSQALDTSIARVNAATFDSNVVPSSTATYSLGVSGQVWTSVNGVLYFSGSNVGIGVSSPAQALEVNGGLRLNTATAQPTCDATSTRGTFWVVENGAGVQDSVQVCAKNSSDAYGWRTIY
ncbi:MAG: type II secretion system protein [Candidatus Liptonbacteria bacterium]|nr:type II secretion system protein [Candidatus Liptonbacteria bacterium]